MLFGKLFSNEYPFRKLPPLLRPLSFHLFLQLVEGLGPCVSNSAKAKCLHQSLSYIRHHCIISTIKNITFPNSIFQRRILSLLLRVSLSAATAFLIINVSDTGYKSHQLHPAELALNCSLLPRQNSSPASPKKEASAGIYHRGELAHHPGQQITREPSSAPLILMAPFPTARLLFGGGIDKSRCVSTSSALSYQPTLLLKNQHFRASGTCSSPEQVQAQHSAARASGDF